MSDREWNHVGRRGRGQGRGRGQDRGRGNGRGSGRGSAQRYGNNQRGGFTPNRDHSRDGSITNGHFAGEVNAHLSERFNARTSRHPTASDNYERPVYRSANNPDIANYVAEQRRITENNTDPDNWLSKPDIPSSDEICPPTDAEVALPANKIERGWSKPSSYLKTHYMLLREDALAPLREAVAKFRKDPHRMDDHDIRIYEQVRAVGLTFTYKGIATRIKFSTARSGRKILWSASKRLTSGTLVALSPSKDEFRTECILATVAARPLQNLEISVPEIDIIFADANCLEIDPQKSFIMIEASQGYFEAYRHTLRALQKQSQELFPLADHICRLNPQITPPKYLLHNPFLNLLPASDEETRESFLNVNVLDDWPAEPRTTLDHTQWSAMRDILTNRLAIIQGPPGTGKTHVSKIAIQIMQANRASDDPPMIIACQTNHALDQLLELLHPSTPGFIRLGGRSTNPLVKTRSLFEVRKSEVIEEIAGSCLSSARRENAIQTMKLKSYLAPVLGEKENHIDAEVLLERDIIGTRQYDSLKKGADLWVRSDDTAADPLESWLGRALAPFVAEYRDDSFGFEDAEEDLEVEQLRELEAETGVADEEDIELLYGDFVEFSMGMTVGQPTPQTLDQAKRLLDTSKDLYQIPEHLRGAMYLVMRERLLSTMRHELRERAIEYNRNADQIQIGRWEKDIAYLSKAPIIGMTTTGLSKYRALISALKPKIVLIEEAAEVLEGPVSVACVPSLEHLILVGDHQQLQANCSVSGLKGEPFFLNVSMFERLVRNKLPHKTLLRQRRMAPEFRQLISKTYERLEDHESVVTRPRPQYGMGAVSLWFFNHDWQELQDEHMSTFNEQEARLVAKFYRHLVRNGVPAASITVLTFYNGQRKKILRELKNDPETASVYNKVKTVDSYQGEENTIVILSLVRNNMSGKIGFLDINNRIVVALSRAKYGFYLFGNAGFLSQHNEMWDYVDTYVRGIGCSNRAMPLTCSNHGNQVWVHYPEDFDKLDGGCSLACNGDLPCGHKCPLRCHIYPHERVSCHQPCQAELACGHTCQKLCREECACDCDVYRQQQAEENGGLFEPQTPQPEPEPIQLTRENVSQVPIGREYHVSRRVAIPAKDEAEDVEPAARNEYRNGTERVQVRSNGRMRYEQDWQPAAPPLEEFPPLRDFAQMNIREQSITEGKRKEQPTRQPRGPPAMGLDGSTDEIPQKHTEQQEPSFVSWNSAADEPDKALIDWTDPETRQWEQEQESMRDDSFW